MVEITTADWHLIRAALAADAARQRKRSQDRSAGARDRQEAFARATHAKRLCASLEQVFAGGYERAA